MSDWENDSGSTRNMSGRGRGFTPFNKNGDSGRGTTNFDEKPGDNDDGFKPTKR